MFPQRFFRLLILPLLAELALVAGVNAAPLKFTARSREPGKDGAYVIVTKELNWEPKQTVLIVCDMWDAHHCLNAVRREEEMVPAMNRLVEKLRDQGVFIIHAPSECMAAYKDHPGRKLAQVAPKAKNLPADIGKWCDKIPAEEKGKYPIDQTDGGEDDDPAEHAAWAASLKAKGLNPKAPWKAQHAGIKIYDGDAISDSGVEIWNLLEQRGINNVVLVGVHLNMCVLGRPFGLRQMAKNGKNALLIRDMTDTMYNPKSAPFVSHFRGTELIVEHVEKFVCPTITSDQLVGGKMFRFKGDK
jgi:nicotinamidase-related amidase